MIDFEKIKEETHGFLPAEVYEKLYKYALIASKGNIVDIGPAQGGSTISFALAAKENENINKIYSIDKFCCSAALSNFISIEENVKVLNNNLEKNLCTEKVEIMVFGNENISQINSLPISMLFIDADGALDRDMMNYYNNLSSDGIVVIDDYSKELNIQTTSRSLKWQFDSQIDTFLNWMGAPNLEKYTPLGKQYTTYKFLRYILDNNFVTIEECYKDTIFLSKSKENKVFTNHNYVEMQEIRKEIAKVFTDSRMYVRKLFEELRPLIINMSKELTTQDLLVYEYSFYKVKNKKQFNKVYEWHSNEDNYFKNDFKIQNIISEDMLNVYTALETDSVYSVNNKSDNVNKLDCYVFNKGYDKLLYLPIVHMDRLLGFIVALYKNETDIEKKNHEMKMFSSCFKSIQDKVALFFEQIEKNM